MLKHASFIAALVALAPVAAFALQIGGAEVRFASRAEGRKVLEQRDEFVQRMSPFDRAARLKVDRAVSEQEFLSFAGENVIEWSEDEQVALSSTIRTVNERLRPYALPLPPTVVLIKTTGREEGSAAYTRANAIILPQRFVDEKEGLEHFISHELFHIMSRQSPALRERLYAVIGFTRCAEVTLPSDIAARRITNPDAPRNDHFITVEVDGKKSAAMPVLFSRSPSYDPARGGEFFDYLQLQFLVADDPAALARDSAARRLVPLDQITGFFEQVGRNTKYIIHPEEILAENFALLLREEGDVASPVILKNLKRALPGAR